MPINRALGTCLIFSVIASATYADEMATQVGIAVCVQPNSFGGDFVCGPPDNPRKGKVTFPYQFGGTPTVVLSVNSFRIGGFGPVELFPRVTDVAADGFIANIYGSYPRPPSVYENLSLSWVAVGPAFLHSTATPGGH
jgi:hypothetical protein